eukprot:gene20425-24464_t
MDRGTFTIAFWAMLRTNATSNQQTSITIAGNNACIGKYLSHGYWSNICGAGGYITITFGMCREKTFDDGITPPLTNRDLCFTIAAFGGSGATAGGMGMHDLPTWMNTNYPDSHVWTDFVRYSIGRVYVGGEDPANPTLRDVHVTLCARGACVKRNKDIRDYLRTIGSDPVLGIERAFERLQGNVAMNHFIMFERALRRSEIAALYNAGEASELTDAHVASLVVWLPLQYHHHQDLMSPHAHVIEYRLKSNNLDSFVTSFESACDYDACDSNRCGWRRIYWTSMYRGYTHGTNSYNIHNYQHEVIKPGDEFGDTDRFIKVHDASLPYLLHAGPNFTNARVINNRTIDSDTLYGHGRDVVAMPPPPSPPPLPPFAGAFPYVEFSAHKQRSNLYFPGHYDKGTIQRVGGVDVMRDKVSNYLRTSEPSAALRGTLNEIGELTVAYWLPLYNNDKDS